MAGDGLVPPLNAPPAGAMTPGVQPGVSQAVVLANKVIVFGANGGIFVYSGTPALGNLITSIAGAAGIDNVGNAYLRGVVTYQELGPTSFLALQDDVTVLTWWTATSAAGPWTKASSISSAAGAQVTYVNASGSIEVTTTDVPTDGGLIVENTTLAGFNGYGFSPSTGLVATIGGVFETWHTLSLTTVTASGNGVNGFRYRLMPFNCLLLEWDLNTNSVASNTVIATLPAGWRPAVQHNFASTTYGGTMALTTALNPHMFVNTSGTIEITGTNGSAFQIAGTALIGLD